MNLYKNYKNCLNYNYLYRLVSLDIIINYKSRGSDHKIYSSQIIL